MSDYQFTDTAKREYINSFQYFLENKTEFDHAVKELLIEDLSRILDATDTCHAVGKIELDTVRLEKTKTSLSNLRARISTTIYSSMTLLLSSSVRN